MKRAALRVGRCAGDSTASSLRMVPTSASKRSTGQELHRMIWRPQRTSAAAEEVAGADGKKYMKCKSGVRLTDRRQILEPGVCRRSYVRLGSVGWRSGASSVVGSIRRLKRSAQDPRRKYVMIWPPHVDSMLACLCFCFPPAAAFASSGCASSGCAPVGEPAVACTVALWFQLVAEPT